MSRQKTRVLQIINTARIGGGMRHLLSLMKHLSQSDFEVFLATDGDSVLIDEAKQAGAKVIFLPMMGSKFNLLPVLKIIKLIRKYKVDLIHMHGTRAGFYGGLACKILGFKKTIYTVHGFSFNKDVRRLEKFFFLNVEKLLSRLNTVLISVSETDRKMAVETGICLPNKIKTICNGVDLARFDPKKGNGDLRKGLAIPASNRVVGLVSRLVPQKGVDFFLQAAAKLTDSYDDVVFLIVGEGELHDSLSATAQRLGLGDKIFFTGAKHDVVDYYRSFDVFVLSSLWEGQPIVLIEALAMCCPTIATITSGSPEVLKEGETGRLIPPKDVKALVNAISWCLDNPDQAREMARRGRDHVEKHFTVERMNQQTLDVYRQLLAM